MDFLKLAGGLVLVGLAMGLFARRGIARVSAIRAWPRALGVVSRSEVERYRKTTTDGGRARFSRYAVHYTYIVDGNELKGRLIARVEKSQPLVTRYPTGKEVDVSYDPSDPRSSYLEVRESGGHHILLVVASLSILLAAVFAVVHFSG